MRTILIVEDEPFLLEFLVEEFTDAGWNVSQAVVADEVYRLLAERSFDVILTDLNVSDEGNVAYLKKLVGEIDNPKKHLFIHSGGGDRYTDIPHAKIFNKPVSHQMVIEDLNSRFPIQ